MKVVKTPILYQRLVLRMIETGSYKIHYQRLEYFEKTLLGGWPTLLIILAKEVSKVGPTRTGFSKNCSNFWKLSESDPSTPWSKDDWGGVLADPLSTLSLLWKDDWGGIRDCFLVLTDSKEMPSSQIRLSVSRRREIGTTDLDNL